MNRVWVRRIALEVAAVGIPALAAMWGVAPRSWSLAAALIACALLPLRHLRPELAVVGVLPAVAGGLGWPPAAVALYALGRRSGSATRVAPWAAAVALAMVIPVWITEHLPWQQSVLTCAFAVLYACAPASLGLLIATQERLSSSLRELREARESALAASREAARAQERARIGREIHDAVGHHATLIAVGAAALAASTTDSRAKEAAEQIRGLAKQALAEMRTALGLAAPAGATAEPDVAALIEQARAAGVDVSAVVHGDPVALPAALDRAVYRVVQEALTNAARHAPGRPVRVDMRWDGALDVTVANSVDVDQAVSAGGTGLAGLAERVELVGGTLTAGPSANGFAVHAVFPLRLSATGAVDPPERTSESAAAH